MKIIERLKHLVFKGQNNDVKFKRTKCFFNAAKYKYLLKSTTPAVLCVDIRRKRLDDEFLEQVKILVKKRKGNISFKFTFDGINTSQVNMQKLKELNEYLLSCNCNMFLKEWDGELEYSLASVIKAQEEINRVLPRIKNSAASPLEKFLMIYDYATEKLYKAEDPDQNHMISRSLISVLSQDRIVCTGYAEIMDYMCKECGIICDKNILYFAGAPHADNTIVIHDDKYNVHGVFYSNVTFDNKKVTGEKRINFALIPLQNADHMSEKIIDFTNEPFVCFNYVISDALISCKKGALKLPKQYSISDYLNYIATQYVLADDKAIEKSLKKYSNLENKAINTYIEHGFEMINLYLKQLGTSREKLRQLLLEQAPIIKKELIEDNSLSDNNLLRGEYWYIKNILNLEYTKANFDNERSTAIPLKTFMKAQYFAYKNLGYSCEAIKEKEYKLLYHSVMEPYFAYPLVDGSINSFIRNATEDEQAMETLMSGAKISKDKNQNTENNGENQ